MAIAPVNFTMNYYNYFTEIEEAFVRRRGKNLVLSPLDWALMETWREREVPLHIVLRAIESVFDIWDKQPNQRRTVKSLAYCREEIEAQFGEWLDMRIGAGDAASNGSEEEAFSADVIYRHLNDSATMITEIAESTADAELREVLGRVRIQLAELRDQPESAEKLEESLDVLDEMIDRQLASSEAAAGVREEIEKLLKPNKKSMDPESYERTFGLMLRKRLRDEAGIPRLSLFYL